MNAKIEEKKRESQKSLPFPKLMINKRDGLVVLFRDPHEGQVVIPVPPYGLRTSITGWNMEMFADLPANQQVVLSN